MKTYCSQEISRGDIYYADLRPVIGSEQGGIRPVLILQNNVGNRHSPTVIVAAITGQRHKPRLPTHVSLNSSVPGLYRDSIILLEQLRTLDKSRLMDKVGSLGKAQMLTLDEGDIHDAVISAMNELFQTQAARNAVKASISAVLAGEEQTLSLPAVELQIRNLQERQLELFQLIVSAGADCTDYDEELRQVNMAKTKLMAKKAELEKEQRGAAAFEERLAELDAELEQSCGALTDFDELTVRQLVSNIKVLDKDSLLICFKDGTEITQAMQRRQTA